MHVGYFASSPHFFQIAIPCSIFLPLLTSPFLLITICARVEQERFMCEQMEGMFVKGEVVVYIWAEWIREFVYEPGEAEELAEAANQKQEEEEQEEWGDEGGVEYEFIEEAVAFGEDGSEWADRIVSGETTVDRKSVFQTHMATVRSVDEVEAMKAHLMTNNKIKRATHNIMAYRVHTAAGVVSGDCDDDGEDAAGGRLLHLLSILDARDVCVVVSRWYGGIHLGPDRFKHINNSARTLMMQFPEKWGRTDGAGGKCAATAKGKKGKH